MLWRVNVLIPCPTQYTDWSARAGRERHRAEPGLPPGPGSSGNEALGDKAPRGVGGAAGPCPGSGGGSLREGPGAYPWATGLPDAGGSERL